MGWWAALGQQVAGQAAGQATGGLISQVFKHWNDKKQIKQQKQLNIENERMMQVAKDMELDQWKATGPVGQMAEMKKAGVNPALMYGGGGAGGATMGSGATGGAQAAQSGPTGEGNGMGLMTGAQLRLINAQARNLEVDADNKEGVDRENKTANTNLMNAQRQVQEGMKKMQDIERDFANSTLEERVHMVIQEKNKLDLLVEREGFDTKVKRDTWTAEKRKIEEEATGAILRNALTTAQTSNTIKNTEKTNADIQYMVTELTALKQSIENSKSDTEVRRKQFELNERIQDWAENMGLGKTVIDVIKSGLGAAKK